MLLISEDLESFPYESVVRIYVILTEGPCIL